MSEIVNEADFLDSDEDVRIVRLASSYGHGLYELYANISPRQVQLRRLSSEKAPKGMAFTAREMDALVEAWLQFKKDRQSALDAEEVRKQEVIKQAYALAAEVSGIEIEEGDDIEFYHDYTGYNHGHGWVVSTPWRKREYRFPDALLEGVQTMIEEWHQDRQLEDK